MKCSCCEQVPLVLLTSRESTGYTTWEQLVPSRHGARLPPPSSLLQPLLFLLLAFSSLARPARWCGMKTRHPSGARGEAWPSGASSWRVATSEAAAGAAAGAAGRSPSCCRRSFTGACALHSNASTLHSHVQPAHFLPPFFCISSKIAELWWQNYWCEQLR